MEKINLRIMACALALAPCLAWAQSAADPGSPSIFKCVDARGCVTYQDDPQAPCANKKSLDAKRLGYGMQVQGSAQAPAPSAAMPSSGIELPKAATPGAALAGGDSKAPLAQLLRALGDTSKAPDPTGAAIEKATK